MPCARWLAATPLGVQKRRDARVPRRRGAIASYATGDPEPGIPFWPLVFKNARLFFLGSDDFPLEAKQTAARDLSEILREEHWSGFEVEARTPMDSIAKAHEAVEERTVRGRVVVIP